MVTMSVFPLFSHLSLLVSQLRLLEGQLLLVLHLVTGVPLHLLGSELINHEI